MTAFDLSALRLVKVPDFAPPYDCEIHGADCPAAPASVTDVAGLPGPDKVGIAGAVDAATAAAATGGPGPAGAAATAAWPRQFAQVMIEILAGVRPVRQVVPWATDQAMAQIRGLVPGFASDRRPRIQRIVTSRPAASAVEMTIVATFGPRTRALAMRFDQVPARQAAPGLPPRQARWLCTAIEAG